MDPIDLGVLNIHSIQNKYPTQQKQQNNKHKPHEQKHQEEQIDTPSSKITVYDNNAKDIVAPSASSNPKKNATTVLDGFILLEASHAAFPDRATKAVLNDMGLSDVVEEDLKYFTRLSIADFGENRLQLDKLTNLATLEELRLHCNDISIISSWENPDPFPLLTVLDLSYNYIDFESMRRLANLPRLRELDLTCNDLEDVPANMESFSALEVLLLAQNNLSSEDTIVTLSTAPRLRELDLSDNKFSKIPETIEFESLEWLSLANNQVFRQADVAALINAPELTQVILYGNPVARVRKVGGKRRTMAQYEIDKREELQVSQSHSSSTTWIDREIINIVTDTPEAPLADKRPTRRKEGPRLGKGLYAHFPIAKVEEGGEKRASDWKAMGNDMIFGSLSETGNDTQGGDDISSDEESGEEEEKEEDTATEQKNSESKLQEVSEHSTSNSSKEGSSIFITEPKLMENDDIAGSDRDRVDHFQSECSLDVTSTNALRNCLAQYASTDSLTQAILHPEPDNRPPQGKFRTAISALRYALKHPLTNDNVDPEDYRKKFEAKTLASRMKEKPRIRYDGLKKAPARSHKNKQKTTQLPQAKNSNKQRNKPVLDSIEKVLDRMNFNQQLLENSPNQTDRKPFAFKDETDRAVDGLIGLVNGVMDSFEISN